jgi:hypothetical protein
MLNDFVLWVICLTSRTLYARNSVGEDTTNELIEAVLTEFSDHIVVSL